MKTNLIFNTQKIIKKINNDKEFYEIIREGAILKVTKKYHKKRGSPFSVELPSKIKISPEAVGLIVGEGFIGGRQFIFANSNGNAVDEILKFLSQFRFDLKFYLEISIKERPESYIKEAVHFWESHLNRKMGGVRLRGEFYSITKHGTIHVSVNNALFAKIMKEIISKSKKVIEKNKELSIGYLRGILAAEGNINIKKSTNCVYMVRISASKTEEREHYKQCLKKIGIKKLCKDMPTISKEEGKQRGWKTTKGRAGAVIISRWENFIEILNLNLLEINQDKKEKFEKYLLNNRFTIEFLSFNNFIRKKFTMKQAQNYFKFKGRSLNRVLTFHKLGYISRRKINSIKFVYNLTNKYANLYQKLNAISSSPSAQ